MLRLTEITKVYKAADTKVEALKGITLAFRRNEFVSVLGPSGCGKTTLLNIIGGLDRYTSGDLAIAGRSTKSYKDADWDVYRNHRIGFIFQSYNLIPHQTILGNVELALAIAGVDKAERTERSKRALDRVGLEGQYHKYPNQLSGGQCQRVAIARALVNEPEILLADEPTGALDTKTSVQIMDLIKEIAEERLVIMVTHNPELAEKYSTRIIRLRDGEVEGDSQPYSEEEERAEFDPIPEKTGSFLEESKTAAESINAETHAAEITGTERAAAPVPNAGRARRPKRKKERAKMSFRTAFRLSAQNLMTKKARTIMTSFAGAIGIIGVSLVLAISHGVRSFIRDMQNDMLSGNPITIERTALDLGALTGMMTFEEKRKVAKEAGYVNVESLIDVLADRAESVDNMFINNTITQDYVDFVGGLPADDAAVLYNYGLDVSNNIYTDYFDEAGGEGQNLSLTGIRSLYTEILKQTKFAMYSNMVTALVGNFQQAPADEEYLLTQYELLEGSVAKGEDEIMIVLSPDDELSDLLLTQLGYYPQDEFLELVDRAGGENLPGVTYKERFSYAELTEKEFTWYPNDSVFVKKDGGAFDYKYSGDELTGGKPLKVTGILTPKDGISYGCMTAGFYYTEAFAKAFIAANRDSEIVKAAEEMSGTIYSGTRQLTATESQDFGITFTFPYNFRGVPAAKMGKGYIGTVNLFSAMGSMSGAIVGGGAGGTGGAGSAGMSASDTYEITVQQLGGSDLPFSISIYPVDFERKDAVVEYLDRWNSNDALTVGDREIAAGDREKITYTDNLSIIIDMVTGLIDVVTIALVGFTSLSLVVSTVMIAIITYVSVVERVKEIGVIRALGGRKRDVSWLFNAETFIIGLFSGLFGIAVTYVLSAIVNMIVGSLTIVRHIASLPLWQAAVMVGVSVLLTLISGLFPSRSAAKKDPVVALRTE